MSNKKFLGFHHATLKKAFIYGLIIKVMITCIGLGYTYYHVFVQDHVERDVTIIIKPGSSISKVGDILVENHILSNKIVFYMVAKYFSISGKPIKAGEYEFKAGMGFVTVFKKLVYGDVIIHKITIPEGFTNQQVYNLLDQTYGLKGVIDVTNYQEGYLLPETYTYQYGNDKNFILRKMSKDADDAFNFISGNTNIPPPLQNMHQVVTLASIVERETALQEERSIVAGVYLNRLKIGMPLQADPTVIYAITNGAINFGRTVTYKDLQIDSPFNTYKIAGLPPTPIANPGVASIKAVMNPGNTSALYFVADGRGGHTFADDYATHQANVQRYRYFMKNSQR